MVIDNNDANHREDPEFLEQDPDGRAEDRALCVLSPPATGLGRSPTVPTPVIGIDKVRA